MRGGAGEEFEVGIEEEEEEKEGDAWAEEVVREEALEEDVIPLPSPREEKVLYSFWCLSASFFVCFSMLNKEKGGNKRKKVESGAKPHQTYLHRSKKQQLFPHIYGQEEGRH